MKWVGKRMAVLAMMVAALGIGAASADMPLNGPDWNSYNESHTFAATAMHQGFYTVYTVPTVSVDYSEPPVYVFSVNSMEVRPDGDRLYSGRAVYKLNYATKEAWILDIRSEKAPYWQPIPTNSVTNKVVLNKLSKQALGIPFVE